MPNSCPNRRKVLAMFQVSTLKIVQHQLSKYIPYLGVYVFRKYDVIKISFVKQSTPLYDLYIVLTQFSIYERKLKGLPIKTTYYMEIIF